MNDGAELAAYREDVSRERRDPLIGQLLDGRYLLKRPLGEGGMGTVYVAQRPGIERLFAVKVLKRELRGNELAFKRFQREARVLSRLSHPHIVSVHDYGQTEDGFAYLAMEYLHGISLSDYVSHIPDRRLHLSQAVELILQVTQALEYAHRLQVVHRDIKPPNILLTLQDGDGDFVKVLDFGIARLVHQEALTRVNDGIPGTPTYAAPEMFQGGDYLNPALDMYAVGIMMFECIVGQPPFMGVDMRLMFQHQSEVPPLLSEKRRDVHIPRALDSLVAQLLGKEPQARPSAAAVTEQLMAIRPRLPPRSLQSILFMQTKLLSRPGTGNLEQPDEDSAAVLITAQPVLHELDSLESLLSQAGEGLAKQTRVVLRRLWAGKLPATVDAQRQLVSELEGAEESAGVQIALLQEALDRDRQAALLREAEQRERYMALREQELAAPDDRAATAARQAMAKLEETGQAVAPRAAPAVELENGRRRLQSLRSRLYEQRRQLARAVLDAAATTSSALSPEQLALLKSLEAASQNLESAFNAYHELGSNLSL